MTQKHKTMRTLAILLFLPLCLQAQDWHHGKHRLDNFSLGVAQGFGFYTAGSDGYRGLTGFGASLSYTTEFPVASFVGAGFGISGVTYASSTLKRNVEPWSPNVSISVPLSLRCSFHLLDAFHAKSQGRMDCYAVVGASGGPIFMAAHKVDGGYLYGLVVSPVAGVGFRYWITPGLGLYAECGWGNPVGCLGVTF